MQSRAVKAVQFRYTASEELASLFEDFRLMCNDAIRIALAYEKHGKKVRGRFQLIELAYSRLKEYGLHTHYILSACEVAFASYRNKNRTRDPCVRRAFLKLDSQSYLLNHLILRIPTRPRKFIFLTLQGSDYHLSCVDDPTLKRGSITLTPCSVSIAFSKETATIEPVGSLGIDVNERNVTWSDSSGEKRREDTSEIAEMKERCKAIRAKIGERTRQDRRISRRLYAKYGRRERNRTIQRLHVVSKRIVQRAKEKGFEIVMEKLNGIRKLYRRGNRQGSSFRGRMNSWTFYEIQRQLEYKARWEGIPVNYVNPRGTSRKCPNCGSRVSPLAERMLYCQECDITWDRDVLASKNIMMAAPVRAARPPRGCDEGEPRRQEKAGNPRSGWAEACLCQGNDELAELDDFISAKRPRGTG